MSTYQRITQPVRCQIEAYLQANIPVKKIAEKLGFDKSSIYRELKRNRCSRGYVAFTADRSANRRYKKSRKPYKIDSESEELIRIYLKKGWSPQQISGRFLKERYFKISLQAIYNHVYTKRKNFRAYFRRPSKTGFSRYSRTRCLPKNGKPISQRPKIVEERRRFGDWERDLFYGADRKQILACIERKSRYVKLSKLKNTTSNHVADKTEELIFSLPRKVFTMTSDNGSEFKGRHLIVPSYFCKPMAPQQRGTVENVIGLIRQYIPRKTNLDELTEEALQKIEDSLNNRPRKVLNYATPFEVFFKKRVALVT